MKTFSMLATLAVMTCICGSCGLMKKESKVELKKNPFGPTGVPPQMRGKGSEGAGGTAVTAPNESTAPIAGLTPQEDIVYTDPDNPDADIPELSAVLATANKRGPWEESETVARQRSMREGKPLLIWFTDSQKSPMCKALSQDLFSQNDFGDWATQKIVRLRVDSYVKVDDPDLSLDESITKGIDMKTYNAGLKKRYHVMGYPTLIMVSPNGEVVGTYRGYKRGDASFVWGQLKHAEAVSSENYKPWRANMEKKGYREWNDRKGRAVFAKLVSYHEGTLVLVEPDGNRAKTEEKSLSDEDRAWIAQQKQVRGL